MADVVRSACDIQEVAYTVGRDTIRHAILHWLEDEHAASFNKSTTLGFCGDAIVVTTRFANASAIEAATAAETPQDGSVHESATAESRDAQ